MPKHKRDEKKTKRRRVYRPGATRMRVNDKAQMRVVADTDIATERKATAKQERLNKTARESAVAIEQKARDIAAASARASAKIVAETKRRAELASLVPPTVRRTKKKEKVTTNANINAALREQEAKELAAEERLEKRKAIGKEAKERFEKTQKAKKALEEQIRVEKEYGVDHVNYESAYAKKHDELLDNGRTEEQAASAAKMWATSYTDPRTRVFINSTMPWGDWELKERPNDLVPKKPLKVVAAVPLAAEPSIRVSTQNYRRAARAAPEFVANYKTLVVRNLPYEAGKQIDKRALWTTVTGKLTGTEIFGDKRPDKKDMKVGITINKPTGELIEGFYYTPKPDEYLRVKAYVTYPTHELAKQALQFARGRGIRIKDTLLVIEPNHKK